MNLRLHYRGELRPNAKPDAKHEIRRHFHKQLAVAWGLKPLEGFQDKLLAAIGSANQLSILTELSGFTFAPLVCAKLHLVAELEVLILWPHEPGRIITSGGDIDNRIKTLLDALKMPHEPTALPPGAAPAPDETPFYCLLEDDSLVTRVAVETDRLLEPVENDWVVELVITVFTRQLRVLVGTIGLS